MANRYANLVGGNKIKDEYTKINSGFDQVEVEMDGKVSKSGDTSTGNQIIKNASSYQYWGVRRDVGGTEYGAELAVSASGYAQIGRRVDGSLVAPSFFMRDDGAYVGNDVVWNAGNLPYESGTWTPELNFGGSTSGIAYSVQEGRYTRLGNRVFFDINITLSSKGSATGDATISGFPFASANSTPYSNMTVGFSSISLPSNTTGMVLFLGTSSTSALLRRIGNNVTVGTSFDDTHFSNSSVIRASGSYAI